MENLPRNLHKEVYPEFDSTFRIYDVDTEEEAANLQAVLALTFPELEWSNEDIPAYLKNVVEGGLGISLICRNLDESANFVWYMSENKPNDMTYSEVMDIYSERGTDALADEIVRRINKRSYFSDLRHWGYDVELQGDGKLRIGGEVFEEMDAESLRDSLDRLLD